MKQKRARQFGIIQAAFESNRELQQELAQAKRDISELQRKSPRSLTQNAHLEALKAKRDLIQERLNGKTFGAAAINKKREQIQEAIDKGDLAAVSALLNKEKADIETVATGGTEGLLQEAEKDLQKATDGVTAAENAPTPLTDARDAVAQATHDIDADSIETLNQYLGKAYPTPNPLTDKYIDLRNRYLADPLAPKGRRDLHAHLLTIHQDLTKRAKKEEEVHASNLQKAIVKKEMFEKEVERLKTHQQALRNDIEQHAINAEKQEKATTTQRWRYFFGIIAVVLITTFLPLAIAAQVSILVGASMIALGLLTLAVALLIGNKESTKRMLWIGAVSLVVTGLTLFLALAAGAAPWIAVFATLAALSVSLLLPAAYFGANRSIMVVAILTVILNAGLIVGLGLPGISAIFLGAPAAIVALSLFFVLTTFLAWRAYKAKPSPKEDALSAEPNPDLDEKEELEMMATPRVSTTASAAIADADPTPPLKPAPLGSLAAYGGHMAPPGGAPAPSPVHGGHAAPAGGTPLPSPVHGRHAAPSGGTPVPSPVHGGHAAPSGGTPVPSPVHGGHAAPSGGTPSSPSAPLAWMGAGAGAGAGAAAHYGPPAVSYHPYFPAPSAPSIAHSASFGGSTVSSMGPYSGMPILPAPSPTSTAAVGAGGAAGTPPGWTSRGGVVPTPTPGGALGSPPPYTPDPAGRTPTVI